MAVGYPLHRPRRGLDIEATGLPHGDPSGVSSGLFSCWHDGPHQIASLEALHQFLAHQEPAREPEGVQPGPLVAPAPGRLDGEGLAVPTGHPVAHRAGADGIQTMAFGDAKPGPIPLGPATGTRPNRQAGGVQPTPKLPPCGVDGGGIRQRALGLGQDALEQGGLLGQERLDWLRALGLVAAPAGQGQVGHPVTAATSLGVDVFDLERYVLDAAIGTLPSPLLQQVFAKLVAGQSPLLVLDALDVGVAHRLHVEPHQFLDEAGDRDKPAEPVDPGQGVVHTVHEGRRKPALLPGPVVEAGCPIPQVRRAPPPTEHGPLGHVLADDGASVREFRQMQDVLWSAVVLSDMVIFVLPDDGDPGDLAAGVELDQYRLHHTAVPVGQPDGEGMKTMDPSATSGQQAASTGGMAGHQRLPAATEDEDTILSRKGAAYAALGLRR